MKEQRTIEMLVSELEQDLIETLRNYKSAYPNGNKMMELEIDAMVEELKGY